MMTAQYWIDNLALEPHPEGGYFKETMRSDQTIDLSEFDGPRSLYTSIYYLLESGDFSALHAIKSDELWYYQGGGAMEVVSITPEGDARSMIIGPHEGEQIQLQGVVPKHHLFGARPAKGATYSLVACVVSPGFDFRDFSMPSRESLIKRFPTQRELIHQFTR